MKITKTMPATVPAAALAGGASAALLAPATGGAQESDGQSTRDPTTTVPDDTTDDSDATADPARRLRRHGSPGRARGEPRHRRRSDRDRTRRALTAEGGVVVTGDESGLRQVVANLLGNARVHTPPGTRAHVTVRSDGDDALLEVADEGLGILPEHVDRLFERFYRADASRTRATGGSGLGLSIVAAIVDAHGGTVVVESEPGHGATFRVRLHRARADAPAPS